MKKFILVTMLLAVALLSVGCNEKIPPGTKGRVKTASGWSDQILTPGSRACWGRDEMYLIQTIQYTFEEELSILVGGKINLDLTIEVRCALTDDEDVQLKVFDDVEAKEFDGFDHSMISVGAMYRTFLRMKVKSIPKSIIASQPDAKVVTANRNAIAAEVSKQIIAGAKGTPLKVLSVEITNYDWPDSITNAQERLVEIQLGEEQEKARIRAALIRADGELKIAEKNKLVELKRAEAVTESIDIIKSGLKGSPEYLRWHEIRMLSEAAKGPNNAFIIVPYGQDVSSTVNSAQLKQLLTQK